MRIKQAFKSNPVILEALYLKRVQRKYGDCCGYGDEYIKGRVRDALWILGTLLTMEGIDELRATSKKE